MFELSGDKVELLYCINCQHDEMTDTTIDGKKFHVYFQSLHSKAKPIECFGPFAYSQPPTVEELKFITLENLFQFDNEMEGKPTFMGWDDNLPVMDECLEHLAQLQSNDKYYPSMQEILIDKSLHMKQISSHDLSSAAFDGYRFQ